LGKKAPALTLSQLKILLKAFLPMRLFSTEGLIALVAWNKKKNHRAYQSHGKMKLFANKNIQISL
jgi:hypothetical protein